MHRVFRLNKPRLAVSGMLVSLMLMGFVRPVQGGELLYRGIEHSPPPDFVGPQGPCVPGFGQLWFDPSQGQEMKLGYYQGKLIAQGFLLHPGDLKAKKSWNDFKLVKGASVFFVTFGYGGTDGPEPAYVAMFYYVNRETARGVCPAPDGGPFVGPLGR